MTGDDLSVCLFCWQVSSHVTSLLFSLCQELNRTGAHALDRYPLRELIIVLFFLPRLLVVETRAFCMMNNRLRSQNAGGHLQVSVPSVNCCDD